MIDAYLLSLVEKVEDEQDALASIRLRITELTTAFVVTQDDS